MRSSTDSTPRNSFIIGADISLDHGAIVCLRNSKLYKAYVRHAVAKRVKDANKMSKVQAEIARKPKLSEKDQEYDEFIRAREVRDWVTRCITELTPLVGSVALFAYERALPDGSGRVTQLAALQMLYLDALVERGYKARSYDVSSLKLFAAHDGAASKDDVMAAVARRWKFDPRPIDEGIKSGRISEDLADAFATAKIAEAELSLRSGASVLSEYAQEEICVFNRVTKTYPTNVLARPFIENWRW